MTIVGDSFSKPIIKRPRRQRSSRWRRRTTLSLAEDDGVVGRHVDHRSEGALLDRMEHVMLLDAMGSTEGSMGSNRSR
jgi:hypothetical protein